MAVTCRNCGRGYDVTLFAFGRTIWCACGSRVGVEAPARELTGLSPPRFSADAMLARLARWLRLLGFDCSYEADIPDERLVRRAVEEDRVVLTRDRRLPDEWWVSNIAVLRSERLAEQLVEVLERFELADSVNPLSRCSHCNRVLEAAERGAVAERVPRRILETQRAFSRCPACGRVYWEGSHAARIRQAVDQLLERPRPLSRPPRSPPSGSRSP